MTTFFNDTDTTFADEYETEFAQELPALSQAPAAISTAEKEKRTAATIRAIAHEFQHNQGLYVHKLLTHGVPNHELDDAVSDLFEQAIRHAATFDPAKAKLSTWIGNAIVRTVASSIYGKRRPCWRKTAALEDTASGRYENTEEIEAEAQAGGVDVSADTLGLLTVKRFLLSLSGTLTSQEQQLLQLSGWDLVECRWSADQAAEYADTLNITAKELRTCREKLRRKVQTHARKHFNTDDWLAKFQSISA